MVANVTLSEEATAALAEIKRTTASDKDPAEIVNELILERFFELRHPASIGASIQLRRHAERLRGEAADIPEHMKGEAADIRLPSEERDDLPVPFDPAQELKTLHFEAATIEVEEEQGESDGQ